MAKLNKWYLILVWLFFIPFCQMYAQSGDAIDLDTFVPQEGVNICGSPESFEIRINNDGTEPLTTVSLSPGLPSGMEYVLGSVIGMEEVANLDPTNPAFELGGGTIDPGASLTVTYEAIATCSMVDEVRTGAENANGAIINNTAKLTYTTVSEGTQQLDEPEGSESYSLLLPDLKVTIEQDDLNISGSLIENTYNRRLQVTNDGTGDTEGFRLYIQISDALSLSNFYLMDEGGTNRGALDFQSLDDGGYLIEFSNFSYAGDGDALFEVGETVYLMDEVTASSCNASAETQYTLYLNCGEEECGLSSSESQVSAYINLPDDAPVIDIEK